MTGSRRRSLVRKLVYMAVILPLLLALWWLGNPATRDAQGQQGSPGGKLAQLRAEYKLDLAQLGQLDPTSETVKLATLGMRGIAANILWTKANNYKMKKDWTNLSATLNQLTKVQPNFIEVWRHQSWNLSYNCSVEFDDYRDRYRWVIKGIQFLELGIGYNPFEPKLHDAMGWVISQKIGRSDEHVQFRKLFKEDDDFHGPRPKDERDNWLVGKLWYRKGENLVDAGYPLRGISPLVFRSYSPKCQINYAEAIEKDGTFGERAQLQWQQADKDWTAFGKLDIPASDGRTIRLGELALCQQRIARLAAELDALAPGAREKLAKQKADSLTAEHKAALEVPPERQTPEQYQLAAQARELLQVSHDEIARQATAHRREANALLERIKEAETTLRFTASYRQIVNYDYWERRAQVEQLMDLIDARKLIRDGDQALENGNLPEAERAYRAGSAAWDRVIRAYPDLIPDRATAEDIEHILDQYSRTLDQQDALFPEDFALGDFIQLLLNDNNHAHELRSIQKKAEKAAAKGDRETARREYLNTLRIWDEVLVDIPSLRLMSNRRIGGDILATIDKYCALLKELNQPVPDDFPLQQFVWIQLSHDALARSARQTIERAEGLAEGKDLAGARKTFDEGFSLWRKALDKYPTAVADRVIGEEIAMNVDAYRRVLGQLKEETPKDFPLQDVLDRRAAKGQ
ncbi:MAG: hypothetical protein JW809_03605 [Pirellulales bacterium]|nr:hypothetical protein [Pirellulales bacterium]